MKLKNKIVLIDFDKSIKLGEELIVLSNIFSPPEFVKGKVHKNSDLYSFFVSIM